LDFNEVFLFGEAFKLPAIRVTFESHPALVDWISVLHAEYDPEPQLKAHETTGSRAYDVLGSTILLYLVSQRFCTALRAAGVTGWDSLPVDTGPFEAITGYEVLRVLGRCGPVDNSKSERVILPSPVPKGAAMPGWRGLYFDPSSWDGSDIFGPRATGQIFVTKKAAGVIRRMKQSNVRLEPLASVERLVP